MKLIGFGVRRLAPAGLMTGILLGGSALLSAQSFILSQNGKGVGSATLSMHPGASGVAVTSSVKINMPQLNYGFSEKETLDGAYRLTMVHLSGSVNGATAEVDAVPQGQQFGVKINASGKITTTPLPFHPWTVFLPDFDPAGLQTMLKLGALHNNRDVWALIPKQAGSVTALRIATKADEQGTLNGQQTPVHHFTVTSDTDTFEVFSGPANEVVQAEWTTEGFALVRQGFVLKPPARPTAPPPAAPPASQQQTQPQQPQ